MVSCGAFVCVGVEYQTHASLGYENGEMTNDK